MIEFELDGKIVSAQEGATIIEAADAAGVYIPRFCYHKKLSIAANCRMCLVEVEKAPKPVPACATPITLGMKVKTKSDAAICAQRDVMEFLLINHPLDCPICDQGGECELQDMSIGYGTSYSAYDQPKRAVHSENIGSLIETEMTRCIQCTRCVRFGEEIAGLRELGVLHRGEKEEIGTYVKHFMQSEISGNIIDLCPVGALTNKPARYRLRGWEVKEQASISLHDCLGTNLFLHTRGQEYTKEREVLRAVPKENEAINEIWISDRDRYAVEGLYHQDRVLKPMMKRNDQWVEVEWSYALDAISHLTTHIKQTQGSNSIAGIASYSSTLEEYYLLQKFIRSLGSSHVDHRVRELDFRDQQNRALFPQLNQLITDVESCLKILLIGSNVRYEQPVFSARIYQAAQNGLSVMAVNPCDYDFTFAVNYKIIDRDLLSPLAEIVTALAMIKQEHSFIINDITPSETALTMAHQLLKAEKTAIYVGAYAQHHPQANEIKQLVHVIEHLTGAVAGLLTDGSNSAGAWLSGCVPHRGPAGAVLKNIGKDVKTLLSDEPVDAYFLLNVEPEFDCAYPESALQTLSKAKLVVCLNTFATEKMRSYADFILPIAPWSETDGTFVNVTGEWQSFHAVSIPHGDSKPAWKVLCALADVMQLTGFSYYSAHMIRDAMKTQQNQVPLPHEKPVIKLPVIPKKKTSIVGVLDWHMYRDNALVRRAIPLQEMISDDEKHIRMNVLTAKHLKIDHGNLVQIKQLKNNVVFTVRIDERVSDGMIIIPAGFDNTAGFGMHFLEIEIQNE